MRIYEAKRLRQRSYNLVRHDGQTAKAWPRAQWHRGVSDRAMTRIVKFLSDKPEILEKPPSHHQLGQAARDIVRDIGVEEHTLTLKMARG